MKTDLSKILAVSGKHGLYSFVAQARNGVVAESLENKKRVAFDVRSRITTLADISIYTAEGEVKLKEVFLAIKKVLGEEPAPGQKSSDEDLKSLFSKAVPDYDAGRFYVSHMKKVAEWYNCLVQFASLDFEEEKTEE